MLTYRTNCRLDLFVIMKRLLIITPAQRTWASGFSVLVARGMYTTHGNLFSEVALVSTPHSSLAGIKPFLDSYFKAFERAKTQRKTNKQRPRIFTNDGRSTTGKANWLEMLKYTFLNGDNACDEVIINSENGRRVNSSSLIIFIFELRTTANCPNKNF